jgi:hypothetical protein
MYRITYEEHEQEQAYPDLWENYVENYKYVMTITAKQYDQENKGENK